MREKECVIPEKANAVVIQRIEIAPGLIKLRVAPAGWELPDFTAGQYCHLGLPGSARRCQSSDDEEPGRDPNRLIVRAYSVASSSVAKEYLEFYIALVRSGELTPRIFDLKIGDHIWLSTRFSGLFTLSSVSYDYNVALIATGTGVAPYMSMIRTEAAQERRHCFAVIHGARHSWDLGYHSQLMTLARLSKRFAYIPVISEPQDEPVPWKGHTGLVESIWTGGALEESWGFRPSTRDTHIFLCGNPYMIDDMLKILTAEGYREDTRERPGQIHLERYD
jgi:ferredoxin--NADP+ reductase